MHKTAAKQKKIASVRNPTIEAVVKQLLRLPDEAAAAQKIEQLKAHFMTSKLHFNLPDKAHMVMWIKGFQVSEQELAEGYLGHFAVIAPKVLKDGKYTLTATKIYLDLKQHPSKKYQPTKQRHPNWGHPVLRRIKKGEVFPSVEEAAVLLLKLHEEYPDASIPGELKLYLMVFAKAPKGERPVKKYVFEIRRDEDACRIEFRENQPRRESGNATTGIDPDKDNPIMGYFTAKTAMKRRRKSS